MMIVRSTDGRLLMPAGFAHSGVLATSSLAYAMVWSTTTLVADCTKSCDIQGVLATNSSSWTKLKVSSLSLSTSIWRQKIDYQQMFCHSNNSPSQQSFSDDKPTKCLLQSRISKGNWCRRRAFLRSRWCRRKISWRFSFHQTRPAHHHWRDLAPDRVASSAFFLWRIFVVSTRWLESKCLGGGKTFPALATAEVDEFSTSMRQLVATRKVHQCRSKFLCRSGASSLVGCRSNETFAETRYRSTCRRIQSWSSSVALETKPLQPNRQPTPKRTCYRRSLTRRWASESFFYYRWFPLSQRSRTDPWLDTLRWTRRDELVEVAGQKRCLRWWRPGEFQIQRYQTRRPSLWGTLKSSATRPWSLLAVADDERKDREGEAFCFVVADALLRPKLALGRFWVHRVALWVQPSCLSVCATSRALWATRFARSWILQPHSTPAVAEWCSC